VNRELIGGLEIDWWFGKRLSAYEKTSQNNLLCEVLSDSGGHGTRTRNPLLGN
tara:strand:- start:418 stop:576 length:159 start_codon:yes stop_codon:yes gene_type:complete